MLFGSGSEYCRAGILFVGRVEMLPYSFEALPLLLSNLMDI